MTFTVGYVFYAYHYMYIWTKNKWPRSFKHVYESQQKNVSWINKMSVALPVTDIAWPVGSRVLTALFYHDGWLISQCSIIISIRPIYRVDLTRRSLFWILWCGINLTNRKIWLHFYHYSTFSDGWDGGGVTKCFLVVDKELHEWHGSVYTETKPSL